MLRFLLNTLLFSIFTISTIYGLDTKESTPAGSDISDVNNHISLKRPLVSLTFDDGWSSVYDNVIPLLRNKHYSATFYINPGFLGKEGRFTKEQVITLKNEGHEIASHTVDHPHLNDISASEVQKELVNSKQLLEKLINSPVPNFAAPFGEANVEVIKQIKKYYRSNRSVETGYNSKKNFDRYNIKTKGLTITTTVNEVNKWLDEAVRGKYWLVLVYHQVEEHGGPWGTDPKNIEQHIKAIELRNLPVLTIEQALQEVLPQIRL